MICPYCKSDKIVLNENGEYVCTDCGTVVGYEFVAPRVKPQIATRREQRLLVILERETKTSIKKRYSELVQFYVAKVARELRRPDLESIAMSIFHRLDRRVYQGKNPRVLAAALVYMAAERTSHHLHKQQIALLLNISKFSLRDTVTKLRRHVT